MTRIERLKATLESAFGDRIVSLEQRLGELTFRVAADDYLTVCRQLRDDATLSFETLIDLCGVDYSGYGDGLHEGPRFAVVSHLLSLRHNWRLRVRVFGVDDDFPVVATITDVWPAAGWFEREAFDLFGIVFEGHPDLRRILTDYGFVGHPFRKDFPVSGHVEMRYDPEQKRVIYQPVSIEPREIIPRVIREDGYAQGR
ncbi:MAG: NADH-quinone oxidoreductase chain 5 [Pseudomonadota bacterium]|jgi:NADH-quinone oxidoreductase subunit C